jgi:hypothetical protein
METKETRWLEIVKVLQNRIETHEGTYWDNIKFLD